MTTSEEAYISFPYLLCSRARSIHVTSTRRPLGGIVLQVDVDMQLTTYCESDWASYPLTRCSLISYMVFLNLSHISWKTKKQHIIS
ncbi:hypothetical protein CR513_33987, partial [Mucuna pruriens]